MKNIETINDSDTWLETIHIREYSISGMNEKTRGG